MSAPLKLLGARILVRVDKAEEKTKGGIWIPEVARGKEQASARSGVVVAMGPGMRVKSSLTGFKDGRWPMPDVKPGDRIIFGAGAGQPVKLDGEMLLVIHDDDVYAVEEP